MTILDFKIDKYDFSWDVFVAAVIEDMLNGLDFLQFHDYVLGAKIN